MSSPAFPTLQISVGTILKGQLSSTNDIVVAGRFEGALQTLGCLTIVPDGVLKGSIDAGALLLEPGHLVEAQVRVQGLPGPAKRPRGGDAKITEGFWKAGIEKLKAVLSLRRP
jgi:hypothetical protein